jgi:hypothetical protein
MDMPDPNEGYEMFNIPGDYVQASHWRDVAEFERFRLDLPP